MRRRRLAGLALVAAAVVLAVPGVASASPFSPGPGGALSTTPAISDCKTPPTPVMPGTGVAGMIDPTDHHKAGTTVYDQYGYAFAHRTNYDMGCADGDWSAGLDADVGGVEMSIAACEVALENTVHAWVATPGFLSWFDPIVSRATAAVGRAMYSPFIDLSLLILGLVLLVDARKKNLPKATKSIGAALLLITIAAGILQYPVWASNAGDGPLTWATGEINSRMLGEKPGSPDPTAARASLLVDTVLYRNWLRWEFGDPDSKVAKKYGRALLDAQTYTWGQKAQIAKHPDQQAKVTHGKATAWKNIAAKVKAEDPSAYLYLTGHAHGSKGPGFLAMVTASLLLWFLIVADALVFFGLLLWRFAVIMFPALVPIAIHRREVAHSTMNTVGSAALNILIFTGGAGVVLVTIGVLFGPGSKVPELAAILVTFLVSYVMWRLLRPHKAFWRRPAKHHDPVGDMAEASLGVGGRAWKKVKGIGGKAAEGALDYEVAKRGTEAGVEEAMEHSRPESYTRPSQPYATAPGERTDVRPPYQPRVPLPAGDFPAPATREPVEYGRDPSDRPDYGGEADWSGTIRPPQSGGDRSAPDPGPVPSAPEHPVIDGDVLPGPVRQPGVVGTGSRSSHSDETDGPGVIGPGGRARVAGDASSHPPMEHRELPPARADRVIAHGEEQHQVWVPGVGYRKSGDVPDLDALEEAELARHRARQTGEEPDTDA